MTTSTPMIVPMRPLFTPHPRSFPRLQTLLSRHKVATIKIGPQAKRNIGVKLSPSASQRPWSNRRCWNLVDRSGSVINTCSVPGAVELPNQSRPRGCTVKVTHVRCFGVAEHRPLRGSRQTQMHRTTKIATKIGASAAIAAVALIATATAANAATLNSDGSGFVGKGEVQSAYGLNNSRRSRRSSTPTRTPSRSRPRSPPRRTSRRPPRRSSPSTPPRPRTASCPAP